MEFKSKKYKKISNTKKRNYASHKNKKVGISRSIKYNRVSKRYYKNNTHKKNKIQNGGEISQYLLDMNNELKTLKISYRKISINGRPTLDSLSRKSSLFTVQFIQENLFDSNLTKFFSLKMTRNDSKSFTVYFRVTKLGIASNSAVEILYVSGEEMAEVYNTQKNIEANVEAKVEDNGDTLKTKIINKLMSVESNVLEFDRTGLLKNLIITDDEGVNTYKFYTIDSVIFFIALSTIRLCFR
jgi:hypothetical protein